MAAGVGAGTHALGGQGLQPPADDLLGAVCPAKMKEFERQKTTDFSFVRRYTNASSFSCLVLERYLFKIRPGSISHAAGPLFVKPFWCGISYGMQVVAKANGSAASSTDAEKPFSCGHDCTICHIK